MGDKLRVNRTCQAFQNRVFHTFYNEYVISNGFKVLEVGCGGHPIRGVTHPTDLDPSIRNPEVKCADVLSLPFPDRSFDIVITRNFISCFECNGRSDLKSKALNEMCRVGGVVFVREYNPKLCIEYWRARVRKVIQDLKQMLAKIPSRLPMRLEAMDP